MHSILFVRVNPSALVMIEPEEIIDSYRDGMKLYHEERNDDQYLNSFYGIMVTMFDNVIIHSIDLHQGIGEPTDTVTILPTYRGKLFEKIK